MPDIGAPELIIILAVVLLLFGAKKVPELARSLGQAQREFKKGSKEGFANDDTAAAPAKVEATKAESTPVEPKGDPSNN